MARRSGLGRGLGALIPTEITHAPSSALREVALSDIEPNQFQPRRRFDEEALSSLVDSIKAVGVLQPVLLRMGEQGKYELIAGERRCRAARRAGLQAIPALVQEANDVSSLEQALVENLHREDLNSLDEAAAYQQLVEDGSERAERRLPMRCACFSSRQACSAKSKTARCPPATPARC